MQICLSFAELEVPMRLKDVKAVAERAGVGLKGIKIKIDRDIEKMASRVNVANGRARTTPLRTFTNQPVSAGFQHVVDGHFNKPISANRSIFSISEDELKTLLQRERVVKAPVTAIAGGQYVRTLDFLKTIGTTSLKEGGKLTSWIKVFTDKAGNLITTYPVKGL